MDNAAVVPAAARSNPTAITADGGALARLGAMPLRAKVMLGLGAAALVAVVVALAMWTRQGDWRVLFANLGDKDAGAIVAQLSTMNVPYRHAEGGQAILVPAEHVHDVRLKLAQTGLPKGSVIGFELLDNARFGQTQFQERLSFQRGLEGELVRSISSLAAVQSARVHLALPQQNGFFREQHKPRASVLVALHPGRSLDRAQVAGIVHLVSSSVPELNPKAVSVLDQSGTLLSSSGDDNPVGGDGQQLQYVQQVEALHLKRLIDILEPVVGRDNLRATVSAEIDFSQTEATSEAYKPNQGKEPATVRSAQTSEQTGQGTPQPAGVPGAQTNQPPVPPAAPLTGASAPLQGSGLAGVGAGNQKRESITNYEVDKTVRVTRAATGTIKRLNAAVVVNHRAGTDEKGETTLTPLTEDEMAKLTALAQEAVGFSKDRGDSVKVVNAPFRADAAGKFEPLPMWRQPWLLDLLRSLAAPVLLALLGLVIVFTVVKPVLKSARLAAAPPTGDKAGAADAATGAVAAVVDDPLALPGAAPTDTPRTPEEKLAQARAMAKRNPEAVAGIVRGWTQGAQA